MITERHIRAQNLDLALIGNSCAGRAGRPQRPHRVAVFPPTSIRIRSFRASGPGMKKRGSATLPSPGSPRRNRAICAMRRLSRLSCRRGRRQAAGHEFRAALRAIRVGVLAAANHPHRTARRPAAHHRLRTPLRGHLSGHPRALGQSGASLLRGRHHKIATRLSSCWEDAWAHVSS